MNVLPTSDERGAVLPFAALVITVLLGAGALTVDLGNGWQMRRNLIVSTDAAALAAAQEYATGGVGCNALAASYVAANMASATMMNCQHLYSSGIGRVRVDAAVRAPAFFAPAIGLGGFDVESTTVVRYGAPTSVTGLRPFALCSEASPQFSAWLADPMTTSAPIFISLDGSNPDQCNATGGSLGNWGFTNFGAGTPSNSLTSDYIVNGYDGEVSSGTEGLSDPCATEPEHCYAASPGSSGNSLLSEFQSIIGQEVLFPVFDYAVDAGGVNMRFHIIYFVHATLTEVQLTGRPETRGLTFVFSPGLVQGDCCDTSETPTGITVIQPCAVGPDDSRCSS